ncbi:MAG: FtsQ-type POTRA domain-containing protein [Sandaracinaceae bacterium]|nr:FtsQ-type POTRA domain-containing protein [Sandaracinaceae bacterium]
MIRKAKAEPQSVRPRNSRAPNAKRISSVPPEPRVSVRVRVERLKKSIIRRFSNFRSPLIIAGRVLVVVACVTGTLALAHLVEKHVQTSASFATHTIEVTGAERLTRDEILAAAGLQEGQNVFVRGPEEAAARLMDHPWIASAEVERHLPSSFNVRIVERRPVALLALGSLYLVSDDGVVFKRVASHDPVDLPVVTGVDRTHFTEDRAYRTSLLLEVVALLHDYRGAGLYQRQPIAEMHLEGDGSISLYVGDDAMLVRLGKAPFRDKLSRLRDVLTRLERRRAAAAYVYLDNERRPDRVTVRLRDGSENATEIAVPQHRS